MPETDADILAGFQPQGEQRTQPATRWRMQLDLDGLAQQEGLPVALLPAVLDAESRGNPRAKSPAGAAGLFQLMPATAKAYGADALNPQEAAQAAAKELGSLYAKYQGDLSSTLAAWNWGQGNLDRQGLQKAPGETRQFIARVTKAVDQELLAGFQPAQRPARGPFAFLGPSEAEAATPAASDADVLAGFQPSQSAPASDSAVLQGFQPGTASASRPPVAPATVKLTTDMTDQQIAEALGYDYALIQQSRYYKPGMLQRRITQPGSAMAKAMDSVFGSLYLGAQNRIQGMTTLAQRGLTALGLGSEADVQLAKLSHDLSIADYSQNVTGGRMVDPATGQLRFSAARLVGEILVPSPLGLIAGKALGAAPGLASMVTRGATQGIIGAAEQPTEGAAGNQLAPERLAQGGVAGAVLGPVVETVAGKALNMAQGRLATPEQQAVQQAGEQFGVRTTATDIAGPARPHLGRLAVLQEQVPLLGLAGERMAQQGEAEQAARALRQGALEALRGQGYPDLAAVQRAAAGPGPRAEKARLLLAAAQDAGEEWPRILQVSGGMALLGKQLRADQLYDDVGRLAAPYGPSVRLQQAQETAERLLAQEQQRLNPDAQAVALLRQVHERLLIPGTPAQPGQPSALLNAQGQPMVTPGTPATPASLRPVDYATARAWRSDLGDLSRLNGEVLGSRGQAALRQVRRAVDEDLGDFVQQTGNPQLATAAREADTFYRTQVVPYRTPRLAKALSPETPDDQVYGQFIRESTTPETARRFYEALDERGRAAVRLGMQDEAIQQATARTGTNPEGRLSPVRYAKALRDIEDSYGVFYQGAEKAHMDGFRNLMVHLPRASAFAENPPTGNRGVAIALGSGVTAGSVFAPGATATAAGLSLLARALLTTTAGKSLLLTAARLPENAPAWESVVQRALGLVAAETAGREQARTGEVTP